MILQEKASSNNQNDVHETMNDRQLRLAVEKTLLNLDHAGTLHYVHVEVQAGSVVLSGQVRSYYLKQLAQAGVMRVEGVVKLKSEIQVE